MTSTIPAKPVAAPERSTVAAARNQRSSRSERRRLRERDAQRLDFEIRLKEDETAADVLKPEFFGASADRLSVGDRISVLGHDCSFWCEMLVVDRDERLQVVRAVMLHEPINLLPKIAAAAPYDLNKIAIEDVGGVWRLRLGNKVVSDGWGSKAEAVRALSDIKDGRKAVSKTSAA